MYNSGDNEALSLGLIVGREKGHGSAFNSHYSKAESALHLTVPYAKLKLQIVTTVY